MYQCTTIVESAVEQSVQFCDLDAVLSWRKQDLGADFDTEKVRVRVRPSSEATKWRRRARISQQIAKGRDPQRD